MFKRHNLVKSGREGAVYCEKVIILNAFFVVWTIIIYQALWDSYFPKQYSHNGGMGKLGYYITFLDAFNWRKNESYKVPL